MNVPKTFAPSSLVSENELLAELTRSADIAIFSQDLFGLTTSWNKASHKLFSHDALEIIGKPFIELIPENQRQGFNLIVSAILNGDQVRPFELGIKTNSGATIQVVMSMSAILDKLGIAIGIAYFCREESLTNPVKLNKIAFDTDQKLSAILSAPSALLWSVNPMGVFTSFEGSALEKLGMKPKDRIGKNVFELMADQSDAVHGVRLALMGKAMDAEIEFSGIWFDTKFTPFRNERGEVEGVVCFSLDITTRKNYEDRIDGLSKSIKQSEKKFRDLANTIPQIVWTSTPEGNLDYYNQNWFDYTGMSLEDTFALGWKPILHPDDFQSCLDVWANSILTGISYQVEYRFKSATDGVYRWHLGRAVPVRDDAGKIVKWFGTCTDIHDQKEMYRVARENWARTYAVVNDASIILWSIDEKGVFNFCEGKGLDQLGVKPGERVGSSIYEVYKNHPEMLDAIAKTLNGEHVKISLKIGDYWYESIHTPIQEHSGKVIGVVGVSFDITERKNIEGENNNLEIRERAALEASRLKSEFLANMSHEIRTPINGVLGMTNLMLDTPLSSEQKEYADSLLRSGTVLLTVINDILDFSKIEVGKLEFETVDFNFLDLIHDSVKSFSHLAHKKGIRIHSELDPKLEQWVKGDPGRFGQILNNLMSNAIKFTQSGEVKIAIHSILSHEQQTTIRVEVRDTGIGIPESARVHLFKAFSQVDSSTTRKMGGTGLGLSISKYLVEEMSGKIGVESIEGEGSTFWFTMTLAKGQDKKRVSIISKSSKILVADDVQINQVIAVKMLEKMGYQAIAASNGLEVIEAIRKTQFDLVLMDCQMPEMDGYEATRQIRLLEAAENKPRIPILALTANAMKGDQEKCLEAGMDDYVTKPITSKKLSLTIKHWLDLKRAS